MALRFTPMGSQVREVAVREGIVPRCDCHGEPMRPRNDRIANPWRCAVKANAAQSKQNPKRIHIGGTYLGTENRYPAPREAVVRFARGLIERHRKEIA